MVQEGLEYFIRSYRTFFCVFFRSKLLVVSTNISHITYNICCPASTYIYTLLLLLNQAPMLIGTCIWHSSPQNGDIDSGEDVGDPCCAHIN